MVDQDAVLRVLRRLPAALFNLAPPAAATGTPARYDTGQYDDSRYDDAGDGADQTPQYNLARMLAEEIDAFVAGWRTAETLQLGPGHIVTGDDGTTTTDEPHAHGADLDRLGAGFGVGRPYGMPDVCYWRLLLLLLFTPGPSKQQLVRIATLYTGILPRVEETPARIEMIWDPIPAPAQGVAPGSTFSDWQQFADFNAFCDASDPSPVTTWDAYARDTGPPGHGDTFLDAVPTGSMGLLLEDALAVAKPAGVAVELVRPPRPGTSGCLGATVRATAMRRGMIAAAPEDLGG